MSGPILPPPKPSGAPDELLPGTSPRRASPSPPSVRPIHIERSAEVLPPARPDRTSSVPWCGPFSASEPRDGGLTAQVLGSRVVLAGGRDPSGAVRADIELWDPRDSAWQAAGTLLRPRAGGRLVSIGQGRALACGGHDERGALLAGTDLWALADLGCTEAGAMAQPRSAHAAGFCAQSARVLACGGATDSGGTTLTASAEIWTLAERAWKPAGAMRAARRDHTVTFLRNRTALAIGGHVASGDATTSCELWDVARGGWASARSTARARAGHQAALVGATNSVLVWSGGSAEIVTAASAAALAPTLGGHVDASFLLADGRVLAVVTSHGALRALLFDPQRNERIWLSPWPADVPATPVAAWLVADGRISVLCEVRGAPPCIFVTDDAVALGGLPPHLTAIAFRRSAEPDALVAELAAAVARRLRQVPADDVVSELRELGHPLCDFDGQGDYCYDWQDTHLSAGSDLVMTLAADEDAVDQAAAGVIELVEMTYSRKTAV